MRAAGIFAGAQAAEAEGEQAAVDVEREQVGFVEAARRSGRNARQAGIAARHHRRHELLKRNLGDPAGFRDRKVESGRRHGAVRGDGSSAGLRDTRWRAREPCPEMILFPISGKISHVK
ncbi:hypothetical protein [Bradyrhizobium sp. 33ap4]|uniref:hypothetical protein n=1 Tax=Bradyrhizobium sp. 33ap4 TaxID=3061630 RepID=UPI0029307ABD|nr:hypothetical protein [Bradyrhizobium sp. 33ap4]